MGKTKVVKERERERNREKEREREREREIKLHYIIVADPPYQKVPTRHNLCVSQPRPEHL